MVPSSKLTVPERSSCRGPTRLGFACDGGGPKYDGSTPAPTAALGGNRLQPGPRDSKGPGPGPDCARAKRGVDSSIRVTRVRVMDFIVISPLAQVTSYYRDLIGLDSRNFHGTFTFS